MKCRQTALDLKYYQRKQLWHLQVSLSGLTNWFICDMSLISILNETYIICVWFISKSVYISIYIHTYIILFFLFCFTFLFLLCFMRQMTTGPLSYILIPSLAVWFMVYKVIKQDNTVLSLKVSEWENIKSH